MASEWEDFLPVTRCQCQNPPVCSIPLLLIEMAPSFESIVTATAANLKTQDFILGTCGVELMQMVYEAL